MPLAISLPRLRDNIEALARFGRQPDGQGITRMCWSPAYEEARAWLLERMRAGGLATSVDPAGNTFGTLGRGAPAVLTGSHIDTVPSGGPLDGALGVLAGLECLETVRAAGQQTRLPLAVVAWSDEEGRYGTLFGSRAYAGKLDPKQIASMRAVDGDRLVDAMARAGFDAGRAPRARVGPATSPPTWSCTSSKDRTWRRRASPSGWWRGSWASAGAASCSGARPITPAPRPWSAAGTRSSARASTRWPPASSSSSGAAGGASPTSVGSSCPRRVEHRARPRRVPPGDAGDRCARARSP